jgi:hypothetical protein
MDAVIVNLQGDEPLIDPALLSATAALIRPGVPMATCAHPLHEAADVFNPNVVKVVLNKAGNAIYFSRASIPWHRDGFAVDKGALPAGYAPLRHIGLYAYSNEFLQAYPALEPAPLDGAVCPDRIRALPLWLCRLDISQGNSRRGRAIEIHFRGAVALHLHNAAGPWFFYELLVQGKALWLGTADIHPFLHTGRFIARFCRLAAGFFAGGAAPFELRKICSGRVYSRSAGCGST